jgi:hypothetical protein
MVTVLLCGSEKQAEMINVLLAAIHALKASSLYITARTVSLLPPDANHVDFILIDNANIHDIHTDKGIVLFEREITGYTEIDLPENFIAIVEPDNSKAIDILKKKSLRTVTCGLSQRDTLTYSSIETERAVISLQREIKTLGSNSILPREIPVNFRSSYGDYQLLAAVAVLLLSDMPIPEDGLTL